jgi:hypothetical protein
MKYFLAVLLVVLLAGCTSYRTVWTQPGGSFDQDLFDDDAAYCKDLHAEPVRVEAFAYLAIANGIIADDRYEKNFNKCMKKRGWTSGRAPK